MGLRFRKSVKIAPGIKLNFNKKSTGVTFGGKGVNYTINSKGKRTKSVGVPGTGLYYTTSSGGKSSKKSAFKTSEILTNESGENCNKKENKKMNEKKLYQKTWFIVLMLIYLFPVGIYLMWKHSNWKKIIKIIITAICAFYALLLAIGFSASDTEVTPTLGDNSYDTTISAIMNESEIDSTTEKQITTQEETTTKEQTTTQKQTTTKEQTTTQKQTTTKEQTTTQKQTTTKEQTTTKTQTTTKAPTTTQKQTTTRQEVSRMVWIPQSGSKYHSSSGCSGMKNPTQVTLEKAINMGYTACKKCY